MSMIHVRAVSPPDLTDQVVEILEGDTCVVNLVVQPGIVRSPDGDSITCDVHRAGANRLLRGLRDIHLDRRGSIIVEPVDTALSEGTSDTGRFADPPVWELVEARIRAEGTYAPSFYLYLVVAGLIGAVGIVTNSQILIVAAMVVGPEYGAIASIALGIDRGHRGRIKQGVFALVSGFTLAIVSTFLFSLLIRAFGFQSKAFEAGLRPVSNLIDTPNFFSFAVAGLAGIIGIVSLTEAKTSALLGVFISVTTIPAAADIGVSAAFGNGSEVRGSFIQLLVNIVVLVLVGVLTLRIQRAIWCRVSARARP
ncbi:DUF389 domain-containing protein [Nonomuraea sp. NPDC050536]|uniref:DUF389 domain-containing protein n=1 Tax=Nonomuraea sp. NPDC050536 TaxID=3364366 RepID=UPI0037C84F8F